MPSLSDTIFPDGEPRDGYILRLALVGTWESQFLGLGRLVAFVTPRLLAEAFAVDDMGVNMVFLQRHRVEVGLKLILERAGADLVVDHKINSLWKRCADACNAAGASSAWGTFERSQKEFADLLDQVDPNAATFRYPVDAKNQPWKRGLVDLAAMEEAEASFERDVLALIGELAAKEPLPIAEDDAREAAEKLSALIARSCGTIQRSKEVVERLREQRKAIESVIPGPLRRAPEPGEDDFAELDALAEASEPMLRGTEELLGRLVSTYGIAPPPPPVAPPIEALPQPNPFDPPDKLKETFDAQMKWFADHLICEFRPLTEAVNAAYRRSESWEAPVARQVHLDVARFRSRLVRTQAKDASAPTGWDARRVSRRAAATARVGVELTRHCCLIPVTSLLRLAFSSRRLPSFQSGLLGWRATPPAPGPRFSVCSGPEQLLAASEVKLSSRRKGPTHLDFRLLRRRIETALVLPSEETIEKAVLELDAGRFQQLAERYGAMTWPDRFAGQLIQGRNADGKTINGWPDSYALGSDGRIDALEATIDQRNWRGHLSKDIERAEALPEPGLGGFAFISSAPTPEPSKLTSAKQSLTRLGVPEDRQSFVFRQSLISGLRAGRFAPLWSSLLGITVSVLPFVDLRKASIYGTGKATQFIPTRQEYEDRSVVFPAFGETVRKRLGRHQFAFVQGRWASGKTALAACLGWDRSDEGLPVYYVDLADPAASGLDFISRASEAILTRGDDGVLFVVDNVHQGEATALELHEQWRAADTGAELLFLGRRAESAVLMKGIDPPLGNLGKGALELRVDRRTLCGVFERMLRREGKGVREVPYPVQRRWLAQFGGDLIAFSAALARTDVGPPDWALDPDALQAHLHERYLSGRSAEEQRALCIVADRSALELGTPEHLVTAEAVKPALEDGLLERRGAEIRTVHPGLGDLIVSAAGASIGDFASLIGSAVEESDFATSIITARRLALRGQSQIAGAILRRWIATGTTLDEILLAMGGAITTRIFLLRDMLGEETTMRLLGSPEAMRSFVEAAPLEDLIGFARASLRRFPTLHPPFASALDEALSTSSLDIERLAVEAAGRPRSLPLISRHLKRIDTRLQERVLRRMVSSGSFAACFRDSTGFRKARWQDLIAAASDFDFVEAELAGLLTSDPELTFRLLLYRGLGGGAEAVIASARSPLVSEALLSTLRSDRFHEAALAEALGYGMRKLASLVELVAEFDPDFLPALDGLAMQEDTIRAHLSKSQAGPKAIRRLLASLDGRCPALHAVFSAAIDHLGLR